MHIIMCKILYISYAVNFNWNVSLSTLITLIKILHINCHCHVIMYRTQFCASSTALFIIYEKIKLIINQLVINLDVCVCCEIINASTAIGMKLKL